MQITDCKIRVSVCIMEGTDTRASGIMDHFPQMPKYQDFLKYQLHVEGIVLYF